MDNERIVPCEYCGTEGRIYRGQYEDERDCGPCPVCEETGGEIIETQPIEIEDLDALDLLEETAADRKVREEREMLFAERPKMPR